MKKTLRLAMAALLLSTSAAFAAPLDGQQTYDLLFRNGTLDDVNKSDALVYTRGVKNALKPDADARDSGEISLSFKTSEQNAVMAQLKLSQGERSRSLGVFPASVGNVKDALIQPSEVQMGSAEFDGKTVETQTVRLYPFANDPNKDRMKGFGDLELTVTMSNEVPGWYVSLVANASREGAEPVYNSQLHFQRLEAAQ